MSALCTILWSLEAYVRRILCIYVVMEYHRWKRKNTASVSTINVLHRFNIRGVDVSAVTIQCRDIHALSIKFFILCCRTYIGPVSLICTKYILQDFADVLSALLLSSQTLLCQLSDDSVLLVTINLSSFVPMYTINGLAQRREMDSWSGKDNSLEVGFCRHKDRA